MGKKQPITFTQILQKTQKNASRLNYVNKKQTTRQHVFEVKVVVKQASKILPKTPLGKTRHQTQIIRENTKLEIKPLPIIKRYQSKNLKNLHKYKLKLKQKLKNQLKEDSNNQSPIILKYPIKKNINQTSNKKGLLNIFRTETPPIQVPKKKGQKQKTQIQNMQFEEIPTVSEPIITRRALRQKNKEKEKDKDVIEIKKEPVFQQMSNAGIIDVCFVVDTTGSMDQYLIQSISAIQTLVTKIKEKTEGKDILLNFAFVAYRDHPPEEATYVTLKKDLCNQDEISLFIQSLDCQGGGDQCEAVLDGLFEAATKITWTDNHKVPSLRYIFHICDAPPHGNEYGGFDYLWKEGCPCGLKIEQVSHEINIREIHYRLIKASDNLEKMSAIFNHHFVNFENVKLENAEQMDIKISDMVIRELMPDEMIN